MFLWLWHFLRGFVTLEVTGFSAERFINMAAHKNIYLWQVSRSGACVRMNVSIQGFRLLRSCGRKTQCHMRIVQKKGLPFIIFRYRKRKILIGGVLFFVLALYGLSMFVWRIDVSGQERLAREDILAFCESRGLKIGAFKYAIDHKQLRQDLLAAFTDLGWADVHTKGTRTTILLSEILPKQSVVDQETPCDIVAVKDGLITAIVTGAGKPLVKQNDVVRAGDVLVSGTLETQSDIQEAGVVYVHAYAEVWAKMYTEIKFNVPLQYVERVYSGRTKKSFAAQFLFGGGAEINFPSSSIPFANYDKMTYRAQPGASGDYPLPFVWITTEYREFTDVPHSRTVEEAKALAERMVTGRIIREFDFQADIIDKQITYEETADSLAVYALITTNERIDKAVPLPDASD